MKRLRICLSVLLFALFLAVKAGAAEPTTITVKGYEGEQITLNDFYFDPDHDFDGATTTFSSTLVRNSNVLYLMNWMLPEANAELEKLGFTDIRFCDHDRSNTDVRYKTGYFTCQREITRNGHPCTLLVVGMNSGSQGSSMPANFDFLNSVDHQGVIDFDSTKALTFTKAAELVLYGHDGALYNMVSELAEHAGDKDYLIWVTGQSRGGAIGNYLAKLLTDLCGTEHVIAYLFAVPNVDKEAKSGPYTSRYNNIFNIINPDDIVPYVPVSSKYEGWGFERWGVDVFLKSAASDTALRDAVQSKYSEYTAGCIGKSGSVIDGNFYYFEGDESNGAGPEKLIRYLVEDVAPSIRSYYTGTILIRTGFLANKEYVNPYQYIQSLLSLDLSDTDTATELYFTLKSSINKKSNLQNVLPLILDYAAGIEDVSEIFEQYINQKSVDLKIHEALLAHLPECYLSWMSTPQAAALDIYRSELPQNSTACCSELESGGLTVRGDRCFYQDQTFSAEEKDGGFVISFTDPDGKAIRPYDEVTLELPVKTAGSRTVLWYQEGRISILTGEYDAVNKTCNVELSDLNGILIPLDTLLDSGSTVGAAVYNGSGKLLRYSSLQAGQKIELTDRRAAALCFFGFDGALQPVCPAVSIRLGE